MKSSVSTESPRLQIQFKYDNIPNFTSQNHNIPQLLTQIGLVKSTKLTDTLQGSIYRAFNTRKDKNSVIKVTNIHLHKKSTALINGKLYKCNEDILLERSILKYLTQDKNCPDTIVKFDSFFESLSLYINTFHLICLPMHYLLYIFSDNYYLMVMEDGGESLFDFIHKSHSLIEKGKVEISHWKKLCKVIFKQMAECIDFLHSKNVCHYDISLENFLINDVSILIKKSRKRKKEILEFVLDSVQIKLCDFGLAQLFTTRDTKSSRFVGKSNYMSPEIQSKIKFDAKKNDIWALGVCLFCMLTGISPFKKANESDEVFMFIMKSKKMVQLLEGWGILRYFDKDLFRLIDALFQYEDNRISVKEIQSHPWMET